MKSIKGTKSIKSLFGKYFFSGLLLILSIAPLVDLFHPGLPITHDGQDHVARIANFYRNLQEGVLIPRWAGNLNWGYGHPILMFLYPFPSYIASLFHLFGFSFVDSTKLVFGLAYMLSGLTMYIWLKEFLSKESALIGCLLYVFAPYRFVDLYVRGAIGEHVAFLFPPLILYFLLKQSQKQSYWYLFGGSLSLAGLILSHNAISLMFLPFIVFYIAYLVWRSKQRRSLILISCFLILLGFSLSAFFWLPAFFEGKYTLRDIVTEGGYKDRFSNWSQFMYGTWNYGLTGQFTVQVGIMHWLAIIVSLPVTVVYYKKRNKMWIVCSVLLITFFTSLFLMNWSSKPIWDMVSFIQKFQFPWRLLIVSVFTSSVLGAIVYANFSKGKQIVFLGIIIILILFVNKDYWHAKGYLNKPESFYTGVYNGTTDTGESAPIWSVRFMEKEPKVHMEVIQGRATISEFERTSTKHSYSITASTRTRLRENTLYFPGWKVLVDGKVVIPEFQDPDNRGLMTFFVEEGRHTIDIKFTETNLRLLSNIISLSSLFALLVWGLKLRVFKPSQN